ncbi:MAG TPA: tRNA lysidine(34) synthetase TilS [Phycisphaerae bacterium]|nr:tRNA lysidine(34) synthetase TilS [Phycisphaerae bacterium]
MPRTDLSSRFEQALIEHTMLARGNAVLVGVSGGADSMALLHLLCGPGREDERSLKPHIVHVNHHLRGAEADEDAAFVTEAGRRLRVPCTVESIDVARLAEQEGGSVEEVGRRCRLETFERLCLKTGIRTVALGHHADDNAETILHRLIRGTGLRGLVGIRPVRPLRHGGDIRLIRPMLGFRRAEILDYLSREGIAFREDVSNRAVTYTRNRIRHELLPLLRERFNPQVEEALNRLAEQARGMQAYLTQTGERMLDALIVERDDRRLVLHCPPLVRKPRVIQTELIRRAILKSGFPEGELSYMHLNAVADLAAGTGGSKELHLPAGLRVSRRYQKLVFEGSQPMSAAGPLPSETRVAMEGVTQLPGFGLEITAERLPGDEATIAAHLGRSVERGAYCFEEWLDGDAVRPPLVARSRKPGDRFFPLGMTDLKKISDFLIDEKIDAASRERIVLLCDQLGPIWVVPLRIDERVRMTGATRNILKLTARPADENRWKK